MALSVGSRTIISTIITCCAVWSFMQMRPIAAEDQPLRITYLKNDPRFTEVSVFETASDTLYTIKMDYSSHSRALGGDEMVARRTHRFYGAALNVTDCKEVQSTMTRLGLTSKGILALRHWCHQERGLLAHAVSFFGSYPNHSENVAGRELVGTMQASIFDMQLLYKDETKEWVCVDTINIDPFGPRGERGGFGYGRFDQLGKYYYYVKRHRILRFAVDTGIIDTVAVGEIPGLPFNSMDLLALSKNRSQLYLLDSSRGVKASATCDLRMIYDVAMVDDHTFLVAGWRRGFLGMGMKHVIVKVNFRDQTCSTLSSIKGPIEFLDLEIVSSR